MCVCVLGLSSNQKGCSESGFAGLSSQRTRMLPYLVEREREKTKMAIQDRGRGGKKLLRQDGLTFPRVSIEDIVWCGGASLSLRFYYMGGPPPPRRRRRPKTIAILPNSGTPHFLFLCAPAVLSGWGECRDLRETAVPASLSHFTTVCR